MTTQVKPKENMVQTPLPWVLEPRLGFWNPGLGFGTPKTHVRWFVYVIILCFFLERKLVEQFI